MALGVRLKKSLNGRKTSGRRKSDRFESNEDENGKLKFQSIRRNGEREGRRDFSSEKRFDRRGRDNDSAPFGRKPSDGRPRDFGRDDSNRETRSREYVGKRSTDFSGDDSNIETRRDGYVGKRSRDFGGDDSNRETRNEGYVGKTRRDFGRDDFNRGTRSHGYVGKRSRDFSREDSNRETGIQGFAGKRRSRHSKDILVRSEVIDQMRSLGRKIGWKRKMASGHDNEGGTSRTFSRDRLRTRGTMNRGDKVQDEREIDECVDSVEASSAKLRLKWKKMDKKRKDADGGHRGKKDDSCKEKAEKMGKIGGKEEISEKNGQSEDGDEVVEQKPVRRLTRVLDKTGKKIRVHQKRSDDAPAEKHDSPKKKKRVIKIDPYDISNKRLDDTVLTSDKSEDIADNEISKNAQFRSIQPSPSILSFVEDNLLGRRRSIELKNAGYNIKLSAPLDNIPFSTSTERERIEENVFRNKLEFFAAAKISSSFPPPTIPEIAFAGRSNVGKSSLLNALTRQWGVVRTSDKPGLTQTINFFRLAPKLCMVDLPGYGFAYAKEEVKESWEELVKEYVSTRVGLQRVCLLIDTKWGMKPRDHELVDLMERSKTPYQIVLTKTDLVFPIDVARRAMQIQENLKKNKSIINPVAMVSSKSGAGIRNLRTVLTKITRFVKP